MPEESRKNADFRTHLFSAHVALLDCIWFLPSQNLPGPSTMPRASTKVRECLAPGSPEPELCGEAEINTDNRDESCF